MLRVFFECGCTFELYLDELDCAVHAELCPRIEDFQEKLIIIFDYVF